MIVGVPSAAFTVKKPRGLMRANASAMVRMFFIFMFTQLVVLCVVLSTNCIRFVGDDSRLHRGRVAVFGRGCFSFFFHLFSSILLQYTVFRIIYIDYFRNVEQKKALLSVEGLFSSLITFISGEYKKKKG